MCSQMERDCRRLIDLNLEIADAEVVKDTILSRLDRLYADRTKTTANIVNAIHRSGKPASSVPVSSAGRDWTVALDYSSGLRISEVIPADSPLFAQPPVADAATAIDPDDDIDAVLDPKGNLTVEIEREARRSREAIIRDGIAAIPPELDPVAGLGSLLRETRYGEPRIPTIRDGKSVAGLNATEALASVRSALRSGDPITEAAVYAAMEDDDLDADDEHSVRSDDETVVPDEDHAVVEHQAAS